MQDETAVRVAEAQQGLRAPLDVFDLAVRLEFHGVTDAVARSQFGYHDAVAMAASNFDGGGATEPAGHNKKQNWIGTYLHGVAFAAPVLICALSMYFLGYSLWGGDIDAQLASAVAVGTVSSFLVTGGVVQSMARRCLFFLTTGAAPEAAGACLYWCSIGLLALLGVGLSGAILNANFEWMPSNLLLVALAFHGCLGMLWLGCAVLYVLDRSAALGIVTLSGLIAVGTLHKYFGYSLVTTQIVGLLCAIATAGGLSYRFFRKRLGEAKVVHTRLSWARAAYLAGPYFAYGVLYYLFLFVDRLLAWTAGTGTMQLPLWFRGDYEVPLDIALVGFVLQVGCVHPSLLEFQDQLTGLRKQFLVSQAPAFNAAVGREYVRRSSAVLGWGAITAVLVYSCAWGFGSLRTATTNVLVLCALIGYLFLVFGLWNAGLLFSLSLPRTVLEAIGAATIVNVAVGYILSRVFSYECAIGGFVAGAFVFALASTRGLRDRMQRLDYYHLAAAL
ncbi:MAG: hypothetical protein IT168_27840 [Bryobacterales bacterium]|nr:hypothetical protein [Bryobacterales bacterium]